MPFTTKSTQSGAIPLFLTGMNVNRETVDKLAQLSRLHFSEDEKTEIQADLQKMIHFIDTLNELDTTGLETYRCNAWQRQLHLYEVPFYYIEYGIAQLGAIGMWMQYKQNKQQALENYCKALALGGTRTLPELYKTAGLEFDFSPEKIKVLVDFVKGEMEDL